MAAIKTCLSLLATAICSASYVKSGKVVSSSWSENIEARVPIVLNTWHFTNATQKAWEVLNEEGRTALDAIVAGCSKCEEEQCDGTVGFGGSPDENGETTLDAMIMDGITHDVGAVAGLRRIKNAIAVARAVMQFTKHTLLVGELATDFAKQMGFEETSLQTNHSRKMWEEWKKKDCQPNFWQNVDPDPTKSCGPYKAKSASDVRIRSQERMNPHVSEGNHDTIGMLVVDQQGNLAAGTSTNGANHKIPGRVGDSPIMGAGAYADNDVGAAAATGDGDVMMRFLPSFKAVELMRQGKSPSQACQEAAKEIARYYPEYSGAVIAVTTKGVHGAGCHGLSSFEYSVRSADLKNVTVISIPCMG